ncbi:LacI family transcriptional regulator [Xylanimonas oleitrophica]|uniref:LacI family transcriptional regulator n=1 Tax=Xylanimonas oleitrophica TaxID=2607479 RepID=A0A2W5Y3Z7_9MICO|nr:LacI family DNA-binding transcriptional regulator [Xylanimonas oleitrophica]PZR52624.1 LacI family transcriptional regulator [Xylanimonas oleitrophica]
MVTVRDVARAAGVSISTVSRALTAPDKVAASTRERVATVAAELGYLPNRAASGLRAGRTGTFGLLVPDLSNPYFAAVTKGVAERAREHGLGVFVVDSEEDPEIEAELLRGLAHQTDGVVLCSPRDVTGDREVVGAKPVVVVNHRIDGTVSVGSDNTAGIELAVEHLHALGHRRIAYVGGPTTSWSDEQRRAALAEAGRHRPDLEILTFGPHRPVVEGGTAAAGVVVASGATAAITFNDVVAVGLVRRVQDLGVRVPHDLSVVSFDDTFLAHLVTPSLTSVHTDLRGVGRQATDLLVRRLAGAGGADGEPATDTLLPARLVVRESTAPAASLLPPG